jgi:hypothetical protein
MFSPVAAPVSCGRRLRTVSPNWPARRDRSSRSSRPVFGVTSSAIPAPTSNPAPNSANAGSTVSVSTETSDWRRSPMALSIWFGMFSKYDPIVAITSSSVRGFALIRRPAAMP